MDDCDPNPCANGGQCIDDVDDFSCFCEQGFTGKRCQHTIDYCESDPCQNGGTCKSKFICAKEAKRPKKLWLIEVCPFQNWPLSNLPNLCNISIYKFFNWYISGFKKIGTKF